ncbi:hypothetical protein BH11CYA1_BH11CYA1_45850 [soil metagenome]
MKDESTESLVKRKEALDTFLTNCALAGVEPPESETADFVALQAELATRDLSVIAAKPKTWTAWLGVKLEGFMLNGQISTGRFCFLFQSENSSGIKRVYKVAKDPSDVSEPERFSTQALKVIPFQTGPVTPVPDMVMQMQLIRLLELAGPLVVSVESSGQCDERSYYSMPLLNGRTLREQLKQVEMSQKQILALFHLLASHMETMPNAYHGDLTPDNIFIECDGNNDVSGIKLLDPGYYGPLNCLEGIFDTCMISTPAYYPLLEPDDLMAVGICLWEALTGVHPLMNSIPGAPVSVAQDVVDLINFRNSLLQPYLTPLMTAVLPSDLNSEIGEKLQSAILSCMHLRVDENKKIAIDNGFEGFAQLRVELASFLDEVPQTDFSV